MKQLDPKFFVGRLSVKIQFLLQLLNYSYFLFLCWVSLGNLSLLRNLSLPSILSNLMARCYDFLVSIGSPYIDNLYLLYYFSWLVWVAVYQFYWSLRRIAFGYIHFLFLLVFCFCFIDFCWFFFFFLLTLGLICTLFSKAFKVETWIIYLIPSFLIAAFKP